MANQNPFAKATKESGSYVRMALAGPSGSGKTFTALKTAQGLGKTAFIDTEFGSARKYSDLFDFDVVELMSDYTTPNLLACIDAAVQHQYQCLIIDSFSHFWEGDKGTLEQADSASERMGGNKMQGWSVASPMWRKGLHGILGAPLHVIVCMRSKNNILMNQDPETGRTKVEVLGEKPIQRDGISYEFDLVGMLKNDSGNSIFSVSKSRCPELHGKEFSNAGAAELTPYFSWLGLIK